MVDNELLVAIEALMDKKLEPVIKLQKEMQKDIIKIKVTQENITNRNIDLLMESLGGTNEKVKKLDHIEETVDDIKSRVEVIEDVVTGHTHNITDLKAVK